jgi:hypothetical protein
LALVAEDASLCLGEAALNYERWFELQVKKKKSFFIYHLTFLICHLSLLYAAWRSNST